MTAATPRQVVDRVERELREMWTTGERAGEPPKTRACTTNIVAVATSGAEAERLVIMLDAVTRTVPARAIVVELDPRGADGLEGSATAVCDVGEKGAICSERVSLVARGAVCGRVASVVDALSVSEMPTALAWLGKADPADPVFASLANAADRIVLDSEEASVESLVGVVRWARAHDARAAPSDLAWTRLSVWQELCARLFDDARVREASLGVTRLELSQACEPGARLGPSGALLLGWLATRLGWKLAGQKGPFRFSRPDGGEVTLNIVATPRDGDVAKAALVGLKFDAEGSGVALRGVIERIPGAPENEDVLRWRMAVDGARPIEQHVRMREGGAARLLERTLRRPRQDLALLETSAFLEGVPADTLISL